MIVHYRLVIPGKEGPVSDIFDRLKPPAADDLFDIPLKLPYLALLFGNVGSIKDDRSGPFVHIRLQEFRIVFLLLGSHEPHGSDLSECDMQNGNVSLSIT